MYIEYVTPQRVADPNYTEYKSKGGDFRPTWLIRTADWQKVPGQEATDGYHTLSYVWEQSGKKFKMADGEFGLIDKGHHRIKAAVKRRSVSNFFRNHETTMVKYEDVLQQVCKDFSIEYLWYDKICIDQANKAEKHREIKQMHLIYSNARYTVALVPEINVKDAKDFDRIDWVSNYTEAKYKAIDYIQKSLWYQRSWTLEEVMMSTRILIVGRNTHFWSLAYMKQGEIKENDMISAMLGFKDREVKSANEVLHYAHFRTSTKELDKIFALANIFHGIIDIDIDYDSDVSVAMNSFYRHLAQKDLSLMCFGSNLYPNEATRYATTIGSHNLPSWTGVAGLHSNRAIIDITLDQNYGFTIDDNMRLCTRCRSYAIRPTKYNDLKKVFIDEERGMEANINYYRVITSMDDFKSDKSEALEWSQWCMHKATNCFPTHYYKPGMNRVPFLSLLLPLSLSEECDECVILGIVFDSVIPTMVDHIITDYDHDYLSPVAKMSADGSSYRIIGVILLKHFQHHEPRNSPQEVMDQMFDNLECETLEFCIE